MDRIAWCSPLHRYGCLRSALFTREVLSAAPRNWDVELFVSDEEWTALRADPHAHLAAPVFHLHRIAERDREQPFDAIIYQLEDHPACSYAPLLLPLWPGIVVAHDLNLNRLIQGRFSHSTGGTDLDEWMIERFGADAPKLGSYHVRKWPYDAFDYFYPAGRELLHSASAALVFSGEHRQTLLADGMQHCEVSPRPCPDLEPRPVHTQSNPVLGILGGYPLWDQVELICQELARCPETAGCTVVWLQAHEEHSSSRRRIERDLPLAIRTPQSYDELCAEIRSWDIAFALRSDPLRGLAAGVPEAMRLGVPLVVADCGEARELPAGAAAHLPPGAALRPALAELLALLLAERPLREALAANAVRFSAASSAQAAAAALQSLIASSLSACRSRLEEARRAVAGQLAVKLESLQRQEQDRLAGIFAGGSVRPPSRINGWLGRDLGWR